MRQVIGRSAAVQIVVEDDLGYPVESEAPVTVVVTDGGGEPVSSGSAVATPEAGVYTYKFLPALLDDYTVTATATLDGAPVTITQVLRVVGDRAFRLADLRAAGVEGERVIALEDEVASGAERILGYSPVEAGYRVSVRLREARTRVVIPGRSHLLRAYSVRDDAGDEYECRVSGSALVRADGLAIDPGVYHLHIVCGLGSTPSDLSRALLSWAMYLDQTRGAAYDPRTVRVMSDGGEAYLSRIGSDHPTGYPEVDYVLTQYRMGNYIGSTANAVV